MLQWVHGPQTVVMYTFRDTSWAFKRASMGPRSSDRGYVNLLAKLFTASLLQWVHGPQTVVMRLMPRIAQNY